ncbi:Uu.00g094310.m01.CDS01 [Anthostomella pinea]|uniref:Uu.00g094310.m01.CDS01 n=1 Tax=Anthostomella pinea TaxID=933095 RepID=A0AAI8VPT7_9PEZI|nr:Uu.00g094310.m01.CDS01 [Anthostomella pinea]
MAPPVSGIKLNANGVPDFDTLPLRNSDPHHSAWGLYGDDDQLGTLNRLTDERVAAAARDEIQTGRRISLNWPLNAQPRRSFFQRALFHQELIAKAPRTVNDDVWTFNSQVSSQWDGLRHFAYQDECLFYGGVTQREIHAVDERGKPSEVLGIHAWADQGIVGRGILVDYHSWRPSQKNVKPYDSFDSVSIPLEDLQACLAAQGTEVKFGDILIIRSGFMATLATKTDDELWAHQDKVPHPFGGVQQSEAMLRWIWDNFAAVAGDQPSFETWPKQQDWALHEVLLAGWGCPIGELFDLEKLAEHCKREGRWSFFLASEPCNVPGGVASPPNVLAIF